MIDTDPIYQGETNLEHYLLAYRTILFRVTQNETVEISASPHPDGGHRIVLSMHTAAGPRSWDGHWDGVSPIGASLDHLRTSMERDLIRAAAKAE